MLPALFYAQTVIGLVRCLKGYYNSILASHPSAKILILLIIQFYLNSAKIRVLDFQIRSTR